ncbi:unnamed protein product [Medioppia subpectinata]|uniref:EGF-like domain-containing protein n=1 Tax=Medioppia subpectinata TaxID=1979941 RepID=A0A7R9PU36_9ACAR|nr:unnamed protein product [Medioppia subpectinata]CAG2101363.1 unnamed protein product [Medioppia subpectinata]
MDRQASAVSQFASISAFMGYVLIRKPVSVIPDKWGQNCANDCQCLHDSQCTAQTGDCRCSPGWVGDHCQTPCKVGRYGSGSVNAIVSLVILDVAESAPIEMNSTERLSTWMFIGCIAAIVGLLLPVLTIGAVIYLKRQKRWLRNVRIDRMTTFSSKPNAPDRQAVSNRSYDMTHVTPGCVYNKAVNHKFNKTNVKLLNNNLLNMNLNVNSLVDSMDGQSVMSDESLYARNQYHSIDELKEIVAQRDDPYDDVSNPKNNKEVENNDYDRLDTNRPNNTLNANYKKLNTDGLDVNKLQELTGIQTSNVQKYINHFEKQ